MTIDPKEAAEIASTVKTGVDFMKGLYGALKNRRLGKKQKQQIEEEASRLLRLATSEEIDKYISEPRRKRIDYLTGAAAGVKRVPAGKVRKTVQKRRASKKRSLVVRKRR